MPRPCQRRRESATAQRKSKPNPKPAGPPPIRHKARQKAIHNARHGRGRGGRPSHNQRSGNELEANRDYISLASNGNNFHVLNAATSRNNRPAPNQNDSLEDGELLTDDDDASDTYDFKALTINLQVDQLQKVKPPRAKVMFSEVEAIAIYRRLYDAGFPLASLTTERYGMPGNEPSATVEPLKEITNVGLSQYSRLTFKSDAVVGSHANNPHSSASSYISPASSAMSRQPSTSTATSHASAAAPDTRDAARSYKFDWGAHSGKQFLEAPESYLKTIAGNPSLLDKHPGLKDAFDYHRPGMRRTAPTERQLRAQQGEPVQAASRGRLQGTRGYSETSWQNFRFSSGAHAKKKLNEVPENYLRTIEGMPHVMNKWVGLKEALLDYNSKTGRQGKVPS